MNISLGLLGDKIKYPETSEIWDGLIKAFDTNAFKYTFLSEAKDVSVVEERAINLLFTIDDQGIEEWFQVVCTPVPLVIWAFKPPLHLYETLQKLSMKQNLSLFSTSALDLSYIRQTLPGLNLMLFPNSIDGDSIEPLNTEKKYDISYVGSMIDIESYDEYIKENMPPDAYRLILEMIHFANRNSQASLWDIYNYLAQVYHFESCDYALYRDIYDKTCSYIDALKKLKVLSKLSDYEIKVWGPQIWKKYLTGPHKYMGEVSENTSSNLFKHSKIVLNIDERSDLFSISDKFLKATVSKALVLTDNNVVMSKYFPEDTYDIYYDVNSVSCLPEKIDYYLNNEDKRNQLTTKLLEEVKFNYTWDARVAQMKSMIT